MSHYTTAVEYTAPPDEIQQCDDDPWCPDPETCKEVHFYRADSREIAEKLIGLFQKSYAKQFYTSGPDRFDGYFHIVPVSELDEAERFLTDEKIERFTSIVEQYEAQWIAAEEEFGADYPWEREPEGPPLCDEENPLSGESLCHQARKWHEKLVPAPTISFSVDEFAQAVFSKDSDGKLSLAENILRVRAAAEERQKTSEPRAAPRKKPKKPSAIEEKIAQYYERSGQTQTKVAEELNRSHGNMLADAGKFPLTQKKISNIIKKVNAWR